MVLIALLLLVIVALYLSTLFTLSQQKKTKLIYSGVIIYRQPFQTVNLSNVVSDSGSTLNLINLSPFLF